MFNIGDIITPKEYHQGFENARVIRLSEINGKQYYTLKILCGTATIPLSAEENYKVIDNGTRESI